MVPLVCDRESSRCASSAARESARRWRTRSYAERKLTKCNEAGYTDATIISFRNGLLAVAVCPSDSLNETLKKLRELRGNGICPPDGWILVNE